MAQRVLEQRVENLEHHVATVEQILPTLATKVDLAELRNATKADLAELRNATKADLAELKAELTTTLRAEWRADLNAAIAPLATKAETKAGLATLEVALKADSKARAEETRRHFDVVAEGLRAEIRVLADGVAAAQASAAATQTGIARIDARHEDVMRVLTLHDRRLTRLETARKRR